MATMFEASMGRGFPWHEADASPAVRRAPAATPATTTEVQPAVRPSTTLLTKLAIGALVAGFPVMGMLSQVGEGMSKDMPKIADVWVVSKGFGVEKCTNGDIFDKSNLTHSVVQRAIGGDCRWAVNRTSVPSVD